MMKIPTKTMKILTSLMRTREACTRAHRSNPTKTGLNLKITKTPTKIKLNLKITKIPTKAKKETRTERATTASTKARRSTTGRTTRRRWKIWKGDSYGESDYGKYEGQAQYNREDYEKEVEDLENKYEGQAQYNREDYAE